MQDPYLYPQNKARVRQQPQFPEQDQLNCPRCDSPNTKFCYYNNYNLSQPRHFCKSCKRYWTKGGTLRNIPVGGVSRKNAKRSTSSANNQQSKRPATSSSQPNASVNNSAAASESLPLKGEDSYGGQFGNLMDVSGSFTSLLGSSDGQYGNFFDGLGSYGSNLALGADHFGGPDTQVGGGFLNMEEGCWSDGNGNKNGLNLE